jgi:hypothetical protein
MCFPSQFYTIKRNLVFMNNMYHRFAVASVGIALGFAWGANKEAEAATFTNFNDYLLGSHPLFTP